MINDNNIFTTQFLIKETLDLILTRDKLDIRKNEQINLLFDSLKDMDTFLDMDFVVGALKGLHVLIDLTHRKGLMYIKNIYTYLEFEHRKEISYSSNLKGAKIDRKFLINQINMGKDISSLDKIRTIKKVKFYDKFYNQYFVLSLIDIIKALQDSMSLMLNSSSNNKSNDIRKLPLFREIRNYYITLTKIINHSIIQEIIFNYSHKIKTTEYKQSLNLQMDLNYRSLPREYKSFFQWSKDFYYNDKFINHKNLTNDRLFEYYTLKYLGSMFDETSFSIKQNPIYKNSSLPIYSISDNTSVINIYYQNSSPLIMPRMVLEHDIYLNLPCRQMGLIPDIIIEIKNKTNNSIDFIIVDAKYRVSFNSADDRYKMLGYLYNLGKTDIPIILMYYNFDAKVPLIPKIYKHRNTSTGYLASLSIGIESANLKSFEILSEIINRSYVISI